MLPNLKFKNFKNFVWDIERQQNIDHYQKVIYVIVVTYNKCMIVTYAILRMVQLSVAPKVIFFQSRLRALKVPAISCKSPVFGRIESNLLIFDSSSENFLLKLSTVLRHCSKKIKFLVI